MTVLTTILLMIEVMINCVLLIGIIIIDIDSNIINN